MSAVFSGKALFAVSSGQTTGIGSGWIVMAEKITGQGHVIAATMLLTWIVLRFGPA